MDRHEWTFSGDPPAGIEPFRCVALDAAEGDGPPAPVIEAPEFEARGEEDQQGWLLDACAAEILRLAKRNQELTLKAAKLADAEAACATLRREADAAHLRLAKLDALLASEEPPDELMGALYGREGEGPATAAWRWLRQQFITARHGGLSQGGVSMDDTPQTPEQPADSAQETAQQEPETAESTGTPTDGETPADDETTSA